MLTNNDVLRSVRYALDLSEPTLVEFFKLGRHDIERDAVAHFLQKKMKPAMSHATMQR